MLRGRRVDFCSHGFTRSHVLVVGFIGFRVGSLGCAKWSSGSFEFAWVHSCVNIGPRVHSSSRGFSRARLRVVWFVRVRMGLLGRTYGSSRSFGFA